jgi:hypothetical protein
MAAAPSADPFADPFAVTLPTSRADDGATTLPDALPARGLAQGFDSMAATMRLAAQTGAITDPDAFAATFGVSRHAIDAMVIDAGAEPQPAPPAAQTAPWSQRDRRIFLVSVTAAAVVGALIVYL